MEKNVAIKESKMGIEAPLVVSRIFENCLYSGFFGRIDSERIKVVTERMLESVDSYDSDYIIIDLSNIDLIDSAVAAHLAKISVSLKLSGVEVVLCGIRGMVAQTMAVIGVELDKFTVAKDLSKALQVIYDMSGYQLVKKV